MAKRLTGLVRSAKTARSALAAVSACALLGFLSACSGISEFSEQFLPDKGADTGDAPESGTQGGPGAGIHDHQAEGALDGQGDSPGDNPDANAQDADRAPGMTSYKPALAALPPGTAIDISGQVPTPGASFNFQVCTAAWSFQLEDGRSIAVTASHCAKPGEKVWAGVQSGEFRYPAEPIGEVIYSDFYAQPTHDLDVAFIELYRDAEYYTPEWMGTEIAQSLDHLPSQVCKLGRSTGQTCGQFSHDTQPSKLLAGEDSLESNAASASVCAAAGDSGGPVYAQLSQGPVIVGLVSGTNRHLEPGETCSTGSETGIAAEKSIEMSFTPASDIDALIRQVLGTPARG